LDLADDFLRAVQEAATPAADALLLPHWSGEDWRRLLALTAPRAVAASEIIIARGAEERCVYFTVNGDYEVGSAYLGAISLTSLARIPAGSVFGEQSFFDGLPRSANVWACSKGDLLVLPFEGYVQLSATQPALARDLAFSLARILSLRLRNTTIRVH